MKKYLLGAFLLFCLCFGGCNDREVSEPEVKTLILAVFQSDSQLQRSDLFKWVNSYNEKHSDVQIEIVNYASNYPEFGEAVNQIKIEINAGKGPDIINFGQQYSPLDASCGMLVDLYPFVQKEDFFEKDDLYYNVLEAFEIGESLYVLVPGYRIDTFATVNEELAGLERMDIKQLIAAYDMLGEEGILFPGETKNAVFGMLCYGSLENYIDWDAGSCSFNSDSFKEILRFANTFPRYLNITEEYSAKQIFTEGRALLYPVYIDDVYVPTSTRLLYGKIPTYIGYPFDSGYGSMAAIDDIAIGISVTSKYQEEAWEFIRSLLDSEFQDAIKDGLPVRVSSLERRLEAAMNTEYDAKGAKVAKDYLRFEGEESVGIYEISAEDAEALKEIIRKIEYNNTLDYDLYNILLEEAEYLFNEERDVDAVAEIIQNRAGIYMSERK